MVILQIFMTKRAVFEHDFGAVGLHTDFLLIPPCVLFCLVLFLCFVNERRYAKRGRFPKQADSGYFGSWGGSVAVVLYMADRLGFANSYLGACVY